MSFAVLPPEVTSAQLYSGAGSGPMLAAATGWDGLGGELGIAAQSFSSVTSELVGGSWLGAASAAMATVAAQYTQWLSAAAAQAVGASAQANAIAGIFDAARAAITHPTAVAANRRQLVQLVRSNLFGFNAPAIAATEGAYESMWAENVAALSGYHGAASAVAARLTPWAHALPALGHANSGYGVEIAANNQQDIIALLEANRSDLAGMHVVAHLQWRMASDSLRPKAATSPAVALSHDAAAARDVVDVGLLHVGTDLRVVGRTATAGPEMAGQDLDILGGVGPLRAEPVPPRLSADVASPALQGTAQQLSPFDQAVAYDKRQFPGYESFTRYQLATTQAGARVDVWAANNALADGDPFTAAQDFADAAALNFGTGLQQPARATDFLLTLAGDDLDIIGGGAELVGGGVVAAPPPQA
jgi:hypothetical protein